MYPDESEEFTESDRPEPVVEPKPSLAPSWVMLGFIVGALFVWMLPRRDEPPPAAAPAPAPEVVRTAPLFTMVEAVFAEWGQYAVWDHDLTEIALWSSETKNYTDCFEVLRSGGSYYFRSITRLTRPVLTHGVKNESPIQFTETEAQRAEWLGEKRQETWRAISNAAAEQSGRARAPAAAAPH